MSTLVRFECRFIGIYDTENLIFVWYKCELSISFMNYIRQHRLWYGKTPSLLWNNCLCIQWRNFQSFVALFVCILNFDQAVIQMFKCLSIDKEEINVFILNITGYICPNWSSTKYAYQYRDPLYKLKMVWRPSQVYHENPYTRQTESS